jgi:N-acetylneuraminate synthase
MPSNPFITAELSANHLGSIDRAMEIAKQASEAGANGFKVQVWEPGTMCLDKSYVIHKGAWAGRNLFQLYEEAWTPWEWLPRLFAYCRNLGMIPFGAAFDKRSVDYLEDLGVDRHKVASFELTDLNLIRYVASKGKPIILSTGMATVDEMSEAVVACHGNPLMLRCISEYPSRPQDAGLQLFSNLENWGLSDHSLGLGVAVAATALGAKYIEKHLTLSRADGGLDSGFSSEPHEFKAMVAACRDAFSACIPSNGKLASTELRRSWHAHTSIKAGEWITAENVRTARPEAGIKANLDIVGKKALRDIPAGKPILTEYLA